MSLRAKASAVLALALALALGGVGMWVVSSKIGDLQQSIDRGARATSEANAAAILKNRRAVCAVARIRPAPQEINESDRQFRLRVHSYAAARRAAIGIDCDTLLRTLPKPKRDRGGGALSPSPGSQLPGGGSPPVLAARSHLAGLQPQPPALLHPRQAIAGCASRTPCSRPA